jgi:predicted PurR-regulated permease PerM
MGPITLYDITAIFAPILAILIAIIACAFSIIVNRQTKRLLETTNATVNRLIAGVDRLEKLYEQVYSIKFPMQVRTKSGTWSHDWPEEDEEKEELIGE